MEIINFYNILNKSKLKKEVIVNDEREIVNYSLPKDIITRISIIDAPIIYPDGSADNWAVLKLNGFNSEMKKISEIEESFLTDTISNLYKEEPITIEVFYKKAEEYFNIFIDNLKSYSNINSSLKETEEIKEYSKKGNLTKYEPPKLILMVGEYLIIEINRDFAVDSYRFTKFSYEKDAENNLVPTSTQISYLGMNDISSFIDNCVNAFLSGKN